MNCFKDTLLQNRLQIIFYVFPFFLSVSVIYHTEFFLFIHRLKEIIPFKTILNYIRLFPSPDPPLFYFMLFIFTPNFPLRLFLSLNSPLTLFCASYFDSQISSSFIPLPQLPLTLFYAFYFCSQLSSALSIFFPLSPHFLLIDHSFSLPVYSDHGYSHGYQDISRLF